jgi:hypothetical protein
MIVSAVLLLLQPFPHHKRVPGFSWLHDVANGRDLVASYSSHADEEIELGVAGGLAIHEVFY